MNWTDNRPIGNIQFCYGGDAKRTPDNPETWIPEVVADWRGFYRRCLDTFAIGFQGVLIRDVEGRRYLPPVDYVGHPYSGLSKKITQEGVAWIVDQAVRRGLWVGFTFRDTGYIPGSQLQTIWPAATLGEEFRECRRRYGPGVKAIYYDTNINDTWFKGGGQAFAIDPIWMSRLRAYVGDDVLIIPEKWRTEYAGMPNLAPWNEDRDDRPGAANQLLVSPATVTADERKWYVDAMRAGGIPLTTATWDAPDRWILDAWIESEG